MLFKLHAACACACTCLSDAPSLGLCLIPQPYICTCLSFTLWTSQGWKWNDFQQGSCCELASVCMLRPLYCTHPKPRAPTPSAPFLWPTHLLSSCHRSKPAWTHSLSVTTVSCYCCQLSYFFTFWTTPTLSQMFLC